MHVLVIGQSNRLTVRLVASLEDVDRFAVVMVDLDRAIEHLAHRLDLHVITVTVVRSLSLNVVIEIFGHVVREIVRVLGHVVHAELSQCLVHLLIAIDLVG